MSCSTQLTTDQRLYIQNAKEEAAGYFSQKSIQNSDLCYADHTYSSFHYLDLTGSINSYPPLSQAEQQQQDLKEAAFLGIVLFTLGALGTSLLMDPFQKNKVLLQNDRIHLNSATLTKKESPHYFSIVQDLTEVHSLQAAFIQKYVAALFLLFYGSITLITAGLTGTPLLLPTGYALITASLALAFFTDLWHKNDMLFFDTQYKRILQAATNCLQPV